MSIDYETFYGYPSLMCPVCGMICKTEFIAPARMQTIECTVCGMRYEIRPDRIRETFKGKVYTVWHSYTVGGRAICYRDQIFKSEDEAKEYARKKTERVGLGYYKVIEEEVRE